MSRVESWTVQDNRVELVEGGVGSCSGDRRVRFLVGFAENSRWVRVRFEMPYGGRLADLVSDYSPYCSEMIEEVQIDDVGRE